MSTNICNYNPLSTISKREIDTRFKLVHQYLCYLSGSGGGSGTVSSFAFTDGGGFDGSVVNGTTTPTLSLTTSLTSNSVPFIGVGGALIENNTTLNYTLGTLAVGGLAQQNTTAGEPQYLKEVIINEDNRAGMSIKGYGSGGSRFQPTIHFYRYRGTPSTPTTIVNGDIFQSFGYRGYDGTAVSYSEAAFIVHAAENWNTNAHGTAMYWEIQRNGSTMTSHGSRYRALTLANSGFFGVNTTTPTSIFQVNSLTGEAAPNIRITSDDISQPFTFGGALPATMSTRWGMLSTSYGGGYFQALCSGDNNALWIQGGIGSTTPTKAPIVIFGFKSDGADGNAAIGSTEKLVSIFNLSPGGTEALTILGNSSMGINAPSINAAAILQADSTTQGFLPPRMTTTQRNAISSPPAGLMVYNSTTNKLNFYNGTTWEAVVSA